MRITFVISSLGCGGAERVVSVMANHWAAREVAVSILTFDPGRQPFFPLRPDVVVVPMSLERPSHSVFAGALANAQRARAVRKNIITSAPDVVISFVDRTNILTALSLLGTSIPLVVSERVDHRIHDPGRSWRRLRPLAYRRADRIVVQTEAARDGWPAALSHKVVAIPNPIPQTEDRVPARDDRPCTIVAVGRLEPQKGFDVLLRAFARVAAAHPDWGLEIHGEGSQRSVLETLRAELDLEGRARLPGAAGNVQGVLKNASLFVLSSRYEGFPNALCEAMAQGLAVISTDCPSGPREIIRDGTDGILVPVEDAEALAGAMCLLLENRELRSRLGAAARKNISRFAPGAVMPKWDVLVADVLGRRND